MFIAILTYVKPLSEVDAIIPQHREYVDNLFKQGKLLVCGRNNPRTGGVIISKNVSRKEFEKMMQEDPFTLSGVSEFEIIDFIPRIYDDCLKNTIEDAPSANQQPSFAVIYQGYLKAGKELEYQQSWNTIATYFVKHRGAIGSCLHKTSDGLWIAYSRWPSKAMRDASWPGENDPSNALSEEVQNAILRLKECFDNERKIPEICMEVVNDLLLQ